MQAPAPVHAFPYAYIGGWVTLLYLAVARRLPLRAHLLLIMPELAMQATAYAAAPACRHRSIGLPSFHPESLFQARLSQLTPLADCYLTSMQPTACAAASVYHHDSIGLPSSHPQGLFQVRLQGLFQVRLQGLFQVRLLLLFQVRLQSLFQVWLLLQYVRCTREPSTAA